jgi:hypothetical protein
MLERAGFDIAHQFDASIIGERGVGILIGNTRALWPIFVKERRDEPDPLERYVERVIGALYDRVFYAHQKYDGAFLPFQKIAIAAGFGALAPSRLVVHPIYGPWFALRAIAIVDGVPPSRLPIAQPCHCEETCAAALDHAFANPFEWRAWLAVRDACALRAWRYSDEQIEYHYTHAFPGKHPPKAGS